MSCNFSEDKTTVVCGNFAELLKEKPKNFDYMSSGKWLEDYPKTWERITIGKTTCDCEKIEEHYAPYYGFKWYHNKDCALIKKVEEKPQLRNLWCYDNIEYIGCSD